MSNPDKSVAAPLISTPSLGKGGEWAGKLERALQVRESSAQSRKGKPMSFPMGMRRR